MLDGIMRNTMAQGADDPVVGVVQVTTAGGDALVAEFDHPGALLIIR